MKCCHPIVDLLASAGAEESELSLSSTQSAFGVMVPDVDQSVRCQLVRQWDDPTRAVPDVQSPRFVRCDVDADNWLAVTWYRDAVEGTFTSERFPTPVVINGVAERWIRGSPDERSIYADVAGMRSEAICDVTSILGGFVDLGSDPVRIARLLVAEASGIGWVQNVAVTVTGDRPRLKIAVATPALHAAAMVVGDVGLTLACEFARLRSRLGYVAYSVDHRSQLSLRLYSRPLPGRQIKSMLRSREMR